MMNSPLSPQAAAQELLTRRKARDDILAYANTIDVPGRPIGDDEEAEDFSPIERPIADHHKLILRKMEEVSQTPHGRAMFFMPPGSAKSTYASVVFPSRFLGAQPNRKFILTSYGDDLARKMGRRTRSIIRQKRYRGIFGTGLASDSQAVQEFSLDNGSEYMSAGILSGVTGNRAHGIVIDDPVKGREQADSDTIRDKIWNAYEDDIKTRLIPGGWIVIIQTRWHEDDLAGRILPTDWKGESGPILCKDGNVWDVVCLQARCEVPNDPLGRAGGEYLWPEWFDRKHWAQFESNQRTWSSLYQQLPAPLEGALFKRAMIGTLDVAPAGKNIVRAWDLAATKQVASQDPDWTVGVKLLRTDDGRFVVLDVTRFRGGPDEVEAAIVNTAHQDGHGVKIGLPQDPGQAGKQQVLYLTRKLAGFRVDSSPETGDKATRAGPIASQANVGNLSIVRADWNRSFLDELAAFPSGTKDDQVDALSRAFSMIGLNAAPLVIPDSARKWAKQARR